MNIRFMSLAFFATSVAWGASSSALAAPAASMILLNKNGLTKAHATARVSWPKGVLVGLKAGECAMIVHTNVDPAVQNDIFNLRTVPDRMVSGIARQIISPHWPLCDSDSTRCKAVLAGMLLRINETLIAENALKSFGAYTVASAAQHITGLAIALTYDGKTYCAHAEWKERSTQLVPFISVDGIQETSFPVILGVSKVTGISNPRVLISTPE